MVPKDMSNAAVARRIALSSDLKLVEPKRAEKVSATKRERKGAAKSADSFPEMDQG